jgi:hypothetical protein
VLVDEGSEGSEGLGYKDDAGVAHDAPAPAPAPRNPRQIRARRRRRRRQLGTLLFVVVAGAILAAAYFAVAGGDDDSSDDATTTTAAATTTVAPPYSVAYKTTSGINVRQMPATSAPIVAVVEQGRDVTVTCVVDGEVVNAPSGPNAKWLKVTDPGAAGYVSAAFVTTGTDLTSGKIPACPRA